jgi:hypothetical protein
VTDYVQRHHWSARRLRRGSAAAALIGREEQNAYAARTRARERGGPMARVGAPGALVASAAVAVVAISAIAVAYAARDGGHSRAPHSPHQLRPERVHGLAGDQRTRHEPQFTWDAVPGAGRYIVFRGGTRVAVRTGLRFTDTVLVHRTYVYRVAAEANGRVGRWSTPLAITFLATGGSTFPPPPPPPPPPPGEVQTPTDVHAVGPVTSPPSLEWTAVTDARYSVYRDGAFVKDVDAPAFTDDATLAPGTHTYQVRAVAGVRESQLSPGVPVEYAPLPAPVLSGDTPTTHPPRFSWTDVKGASLYVVFDGGVEVVRTSNHSWADPKAVPGYTYVYTVRALDSQGNAGTLSNRLPIEYDGSLGQ